MTVAFAGTFTFAPMAVMTPFAKMMVPFAIGAEVTGTMFALRIANVPFVPGLLTMTDCARSGAARTKAASVLIILLLLRILGVLLVLRLFVFFLLQPIAFLLRHRLAVRKIGGAVEHHFAFDEGRVDARVRRERMSVPDHDVGVLACFDRSDAVIEAELLRGID